MADVTISGLNDLSPSGSTFLPISDSSTTGKTSLSAAINTIGSRTDSIKLPSGTTAQRPTSLTLGSIRFNSTTNLLEFYNGTEWRVLDSKSADSLIVEYLVIGGGGGGGGSGNNYTAGGGGGAGGFLEGVMSLNLGTSYQLTIGAGGIGGTYWNSPGSNGGVTTFGSVIAGGGGGGGAYSVGPNNGASGGGGGNGSWPGGTGFGTQGYSGGTGGPYANNTGSQGGAGGGGAGSPGQNFNGSGGGSGGAGRISSITGIMYCCGGGGGGRGGGGGGNGRIDCPGVSIGGLGAPANTNGGNGGSYGSGGGGACTDLAGTRTGGTGSGGVVVLKVPENFTATFSSGIVQTNYPSLGYKIYTIGTAGITDTVTFN